MDMTPYAIHIENCNSEAMAKLSQKLLIMSGLIELKIVVINEITANITPIKKMIK
jgi:hypothetical protein